MTRKYLTQDEVYRLMDAAQSMSFPERNRCLIMMAFIHGFRASELLDLRLSDINEGLENAIKILEQTTGHLEFEEKYACSSAAGGLKMVSRQHILFFLMNII